MSQPRRPQNRSEILKSHLIVIPVFFTLMIFKQFMLFHQTLYKETLLQSKRDYNFNLMHLRWYLQLLKEVRHTNVARMRV